MMLEWVNYIDFDKHIWPWLQLFEKSRAGDVFVIESDGHNLITMRSHERTLVLPSEYRTRILGVTETLPTLHKALQLCLAAMKERKTYSVAIKTVKEAAPTLS